VDGEAVYCDGTAQASLICSDLYGNAGGDWVGAIADQLGQDGNFSEAPLFCGEETLLLDDRSPCSPLHPQNECGLIGAWPRGCQTPMSFTVTPEGTGDFATIQAAIEFARPGDTIGLADGIFTGEGNYEIDFLGKAITLQSVSGDPATCVLDCEQRGRALSFVRGEGPGTIVHAITIRRGRAEAG
jgi:hypothetical protein